MSYRFENTWDGAALRGEAEFDYCTESESTNTVAISFWMDYAWSTFCLQWVAVSWAAVVGRES